MAVLPSELWLEHVLPRLSIAQRVFSVQFVDWLFNSLVWRSITHLDLTAPDLPGPSLASYLSGDNPKGRIISHDPVGEFPLFARLARERVMSLRLPRIDNENDDLGTLVTLFPNLREIAFGKYSQIYTYTREPDTGILVVIESLENTPLRMLTKLQSLALPQPDVKMLNFDRLSTLRSLVFSPKYIDIQFSTALFYALQRCERLTSLDVGANPVDLSLLPNLRHFRTRWQNDELTKKLLSFPGSNLTSLDLGCYTNLRPCGSNIERSLRRLVLRDEDCMPPAFLRVLDLVHFQLSSLSLFGDVGSVRSVIEALQACPRITSIRLRCEFFDTVELLAPFITSFSEISHLSLRGLSHFSKVKAFCAALPNLMQLESLELTHNAPVSSSCYETLDLTPLTRLTHLKLNCCPNNPRFMEIWTQMTQLTHLSLSLLSEEGDLHSSVSLLSRLEKLEWLQFQFIKFVPHLGTQTYGDENLIDYLSGLNTLRFLEFLHLHSQTTLTENQVRSVFSFVPVVDLSNNDYKFPCKE